jgi:hypothetical protein
MRIPDPVKIGAATVRVQLTDSVKSEGYDVLGTSKGCIGRIEISTTYMGEPITEEAMADTFLHEILHILSGNFGLGLTERQVAGLSGGLLMVIRDNDLDFREGK